MKGAGLCLFVVELFADFFVEFFGLFVVGVAFESCEECVDVSDSESESVDLVFGEFVVFEVAFEVFVFFVDFEEVDVDASEFVHVFFDLVGHFGEVCDDSFEVFEAEVEDAFEVVVVVVGLFWEDVFGDFFVDVAVFVGELEEKVEVFFELFFDGDCFDFGGNFGFFFEEDVVVFVGVFFVVVDDGVVVFVFSVANEALVNSVGNCVFFLVVFFLGNAVEPR